MRTFFFVLIVGVATSLTASRSTLAADPAGPHQLRAHRSSGEVCRVEISLEAGGELKVHSADKTPPLKMSVVGAMNYEERILGYPATEADTWRSVRYYEEATAALKIGRNGMKPRLREQRRLVTVAVRDTSTMLGSPAGSLTREELDLLNIAGNGIANSLVLDRLLPMLPVSVGDTWGHSQTVVGALLGLDRVAKSDVESKLVDVVNGVARIQLGGRVEGTSEGATVEMDVKAKYQVDLKSKRVNWLGLLVRENREIGEVVPGTDVVLRLEMTITPVPKSERLTDAVVQGIRPQSETTKLALEHRSADGLWTLMYGRDWYVTADERDLTVLKLMSEGERIVQCNVSSLPKVDVAKLPTLAEFKEEVREALGKNFTEFVEVGQSPNEVNYRIYRVVARGSVNELPIEWHYYLVANEHGQQAAFAFTVDTALVNRLASLDRQLVNQFRFEDPKLAAKPTPSK
jgi:hypothetical protein